MITGKVKGGGAKQSRTGEEVKVSKGRVYQLRKSRVGEAVTGRVWKGGAGPSR